LLQNFLQGRKAAIVDDDDDDDDGGAVAVEARDLSDEGGEIVDIHLRDHVLRIDFVFELLSQ
jgi:hypothetical protein